MLERISKITHEGMLTSKRLSAFNSRYLACFQYPSQMSEPHTDNVSKRTVSIIVLTTTMLFLEVASDTSQISRNTFVGEE